MREVHDMVQKMSDLRSNFEARSRFIENLLLDGRAIKGNASGHAQG